VTLREQESLTAVSGSPPRESLARCAARARLRGDPMLGSAFPAARLLLVEQPGPWGRDGLRTSGFDPEVAAALERRGNAEGVRVQAIRSTGRTGRGLPRRWAVADCRDGRESLRWGTFERDAELLDLPLDGSMGEADSAPLYLVCAHSKHDLCCAMLGRPVAAAIEQARPGRVFECSHLGGDRFAANVLVLPVGLLYGQVPAVAVPEFVAVAEADEVLTTLLRGRVGLPPVAQAALAFGYEQLALHRRSALRVESATRIVDGVAVVRLAGPSGVLEVTVAVEKVAADGLTCANPRPNHYLHYRPVSVVTVHGQS
jgi:hypothetical protein